MKIKIISIFALLLLVSSCEKDKPQTLVLHAPQQVDNTIVLNWEQANISDFEYYMVMRSADRKEYEIINDIVTPTSDAFRREVTTFEDRTYPLGIDSIYYKIMAVGKDIQSSQGLCYRIEQPVRFLKGNIRDVHFIDETNKVSVLLYDNGYKLKIFDLETGQFSSNAAQIDLSYSTSWYLWGENNEKNELYNYHNDIIYVYDLSTLQQVTTLHPPFIWYAPCTVNNKGIIYFYYDNYLYLLNRITGDYTQYQLIDNFYANHLNYNPKDNKLYARNDVRIQIFILDNNGNVTDEVMYTMEYNYYNLKYVENSSLFVVSIGSDHKILDLNTKILHNTSLTRMPNIIILNDSYLYVTDQSSRNIYQLSAENYSIIKTIPVRVVPEKFFVSNGYLYFFGQYEYDTYIIDKIKI